MILCPGITGLRYVRSALHGTRINTVPRRKACLCCHFSSEHLGSHDDTSRIGTPNKSLLALQRESVPNAARTAVIESSRPRHLDSVPDLRPDPLLNLEIFGMFPAFAPFLSLR